MFKLTNEQAGAFNSPIIAKLFTDENRRFPTVDAFKLSDLIASIQSRLGPYRDAVKKIIDEHGGALGNDGIIQYPDVQRKDEAQALIIELNAVELEYPGELITPTDGWPNLTIAEATILKPLLNANGAKR